MHSINIARDGDTVMLSPASTSFDGFKNFEERGDAFKSIVRLIKDNKKQT
jgi:UDP-N-acetylmuramoylalanine--D-glutamate ligase